MAKSGMTMTGLGMMAVGILTLIVTFTIIPIVGDQLDNAVTLPACVNTSEFAANGTCAVSGETTGATWNPGLHSDIPTGVNLWTSVGGILKVGAIIVVVAGFLTTLKGLKG